MTSKLDSQTIKTCQTTHEVKATRELNLVS